MCFKFILDFASILFNDYFLLQTHLTMPHLQNSDSMAALNVNDNDSASRDDLNLKNDILQKALERIGLPLSDGSTENSGVTEFLFIIFLDFPP